MTVSLLSSVKLMGGRRAVGILTGVSVEH